MFKQHPWNPANWLTFRTEQEIGHNRKRLVLFLFSSLGAVALGYFGFIWSDKADTVLRTILISAFFAVVGLSILSLWDKWITQACYIGTALMLSLQIALFCHGGWLGTALYWQFVFPMVIFTIIGPHLGAILNGSLLLGFVIAQQQPWVHHYAEHELSRFYIAFFALTLFGYITEYYRHRSHQIMTRAHSEQARQANTDPLTQLPNRRFMDSVYLPLHGNQTASLPLGIIVGDLDYFKRVNDS